MIEICTVGGYSEVGKNMTAVKYKDEVIIFDMGLEMDCYVRYKGEEEVENLSKKELIKIGAIPDDNLIKDWKKDVIAIIPSHGHLDHLGAVPFLAHAYNCPIICSRYTGEILRRILEDRKKKLPNEIVIIGNNQKIQISKDIEIEFINITHSIPDTVMVAMHTPDGTIVYGNDFKLDNTPVIGQIPNYKRLKQIGKTGVKLLILDSLYSRKEGKTPSESVARNNLMGKIFSIPKKEGIIITTFSSHIARLKSIIDIGKKLKRQIVFLGRSMAKYSYAAEDTGIISFSNEAKICGFRSQIRKKLKKIEKEGHEKYLIVVTGHQGEPDAILSRIANNHFDFKLNDMDNVIFSCSIIPNEQNIENREKLEEKILQKNAKIIKDIHVSGHGSRDDHKEVINLLQPQNIMPAHGSKDKTSGLKDLSLKLGYTEENIHLMENAKRIILK